MHPSSLTNMRFVKEKYLQMLDNKITIVDIGGRGLDTSKTWMPGQEQR